MAYEFRMPDVGEGVVEGEVVRWRVKQGDAIQADQPMVDVMTDKATIEIPSPKSGRVARIAVGEGEKCPVGATLVVIDEEKGEARGAAPARRELLAASVGSRREAGAAAVPDPDQAPSEQRQSGSATIVGRALATPAVRQLAREKGLDIRRVVPSGPHGRVLREDVLATASGARSLGPVPAAAPVPAAESGAATAAAAEPEPRRQPTVLPRESEEEERLPLRGIRRLIAENLTRSRRTAAHYTYVEEVDLTELVALKGRAQARAEAQGIRLTYLPFIVKAVAAGLRKYPILNASLDDERQEVVIHHRYHLGIAAAGDEGLLVPVIRDVDRKSVYEIAREVAELGERAKAGKATREELVGSTFTISSLGNLGGLFATPIIRHPEVAILGVHKIRPAPVVREGAVVVREMSHFSLSLDHRVVDGYEGARFLAHVIALLEDPTLMFLDLV